MAVRGAPRVVGLDSVSLPGLAWGTRDCGPRARVRERRETGAFFLTPSPRRSAVVIKNLEQDTQPFWTQLHGFLAV